jgi:hypothetical protein
MPTGPKLSRSLNHQHSGLRGDTSFAKFGGAVSKGWKLNMKIFGVGLFRTGTTTMCEMFAKSFRADHEFWVEEELDAIVKRFTGAVSDEELGAFVEVRDKEKPLDLDSSGAHFGLIDILTTEFPDAKFILTLRNVYSWLNSCVGKLYGDFIGGRNSRIGELANCLDCLPDYTFAIEDRTGYRICLEQMIKTWNGVNRSIMRLVPPERLLVLNTETLSHSADEIAIFCEIDQNLLESCHSNSGPAVNFLACFNPERLDELVRQHCLGMMSEAYPAYILRPDAKREWSAAPPEWCDLLRYFSLDQFYPLQPTASATALDRGPF